MCENNVLKIVPFPSAVHSSVLLFERVLTFSRHCGITARAPPCHSTPWTNRLHCFDCSQLAVSQSRSSFARQRRPLQTINPAFLTHLGEKLLPKIAQRESSSIRSCDEFVSLIHEFSPLFRFLFSFFFPHAIVIFYSSRLKSNTTIHHNTGNTNTRQYNTMSTMHSK